MRRFAVVVVAGMVAAAAAPGAGQVGVRVGAVWPTGDDLVPLLELDGVFEKEDLPVALVVGVGKGTAERAHVFCGGFVPPDADCSPQTSRAETSSLHAALALVAPTDDSGAWSTDIVPRVGLALVRSSWHSLETDEFAEGGLSLLLTFALAGQVGYDLSPYLPARLLLGVEGLAALGYTGECLDCDITSYDDGYSSVGVYLGFSTYGLGR